MKMRKTTIVVPFFNGANTLKRCIESIIAQTVRNWELILVNDGSTDDSLEVCLQFAAKDDRIRVFNGAHQGVGAARNLGIKHANGEKLCFVDADDYIEPNFLDEFMRGDEVDLMVCGYKVDYQDEFGRLQSIVDHSLKTMRFNDGNGRLALESAFSDGIMCFIWNKMFDLKIIRENNICFNSYPVNEDYIFVLNYLNCCSSVKLISKSTYHWINVKHRLSAVESLPKNILEIYEHSHRLLAKYLHDKIVADRIAYRSYELLIYKYLKLYRAGHIGYSECFGSLKLLNNSNMVQDAFDAYTPTAKVERVIYKLNKHGLFYLTYMLQTCIIKLKK